MATIRTFIVDPNGSKKTQIEVPDNVAVHRLVNGLVKRMGLPQQNQDGDPINFRLSRVRDNNVDELSGDETLQGAGVENDDLLRLYADIQTGRISGSFTNEMRHHPQENPAQADLQKIYVLLEELKSKSSRSRNNLDLVEMIRSELEQEVEPFSIPIVIHDTEKEPIPLVRADRLHIIEEYRDDQNKALAVAWAFWGAALGITVNWITSEPLEITRVSVIIIGIFTIVGFLAWLFSHKASKRAERFKKIILYGEDDRINTLRNQIGQNS